jgi:serine O-acetyltransferase
MTEDFKNHLIEKHQRCKGCPSNEAIKNLFEDIMALLFPDFSNLRLSNLELINNSIDKIKHGLKELFVHHPSLCSSDHSIVANKFMAVLEKIEKTIQMDVDAIYNGDPAAKSKEEVIRSYPGFYAIAAYRIAHQLHLLGIQVIPRIITEIAHHRTGIDIHPAAQIDHSFCIDDGTGVVIGETTVIGNNVKIYQGVTLGALSVNKKDANSKRHPTIESHVVIYASATILGGNTTIGQHSIIGGNVWITESVEPHSTVYYVAGDNQIEKHK